MMTVKKVLFSLLLCFFVVGCQAGGDDVDLPPTAVPVANIQAVFANSEFNLATQRMGIVLLTPENQLIQEAEVVLQYFDITEADAVAEQTSVAQRIQSNDGTTTMFVDHRTFDRVGPWGVLVTATLADGSVGVQRLRFEVEGETAVLSPTEPVPALKTPTEASVEGDFSKITSATTPNPAFYQLTLEDALNNNKPTLLYLSTPAFCSSRVCGPGYDNFNALYEQFGEQFNFLHVEVYSSLPDPSVNSFELAPVMGAFGLATEPWLYVIDAEGDVYYHLEGLFTAPELTPILQNLQ